MPGTSKEGKEKEEMTLSDHVSKGLECLGEKLNFIFLQWEHVSNLVTFKRFEIKSWLLDG